MVDRLIIGNGISIPLAEIEIRAIRAQGAGGQNVNKVASAIQLCFDFENSTALPDRIRQRLADLDDQRVTARGIVIKAQEHRRQAQNRQAALDRLQALIAGVLADPKPRVPTKPTKASRVRRVDNKRRQGLRKRGRQKPPVD